MTSKGNPLKVQADEREFFRKIFGSAAPAGGRRTCAVRRVLVMCSPRLMRLFD
jgi:hypothetical protein